MTRDLHPGIAVVASRPPLSMVRLLQTHLTMLDHDGLMGDFPTQAELAAALSEATAHLSPPAHVGTLRVGGEAKDGRSFTLRADA